MDYSKLSKEELIALLENRDAELYQTRKERDDALKKLEEVIEKKNIFSCRLVENIQNGEKTKNKLVGAGAKIKNIVYKENVEIIFEIDDLEKVQEFEFTLIGEENGNNQN